MIRKLIAAVICLVGFNVFFYFNLPLFGIGRLSFLLMLAICHTALHVAYFERPFQLRHKVSAALSGLALSSAFLSLFWANEIAWVLLWFTSVGLSFLSWYVHALSHNRFGAVSELLVVPFHLGFGWFFSALKQLLYGPEFIAKSLGLLRKSSVLSPTRHVINPRVIRGLLLTIPVVFVLLALLKSADPIFEQMINRLTDWNFSFPQLSADLIGRFIFSAVIAAIIVPATNLVIGQTFKSPFGFSWWGKLATEATMVVGAVGFILAVFLAVQFRYLFAAVPETELHQFGINTYSEYVRKGFGELVMVAGLIYGVVGLSLAVLRKVGTDGADHLKKLNLLVLGEGLVFILSIFRRVVLYQADHGLTRVRIYGSLFLLVLIALTAVLIARHLLKRRVFWSAIEISIIVAGIFVSVIFNVDKAIATHFPPTVNQEIDYGYVSRLSADGAEGWVAAYKHAQEVLGGMNPDTFTKRPPTEEEARQIKYAREALIAVEGNYFNLEQRYSVDASYSWQDINMAEKAAHTYLINTVPLYEVQAALGRANLLYSQLIDTQQKKNYDRSSNTPLLD